MGLTSFWPLSQEPKIGHLRDDAKGDSSKTFGLLHFTRASGQLVGKMDTEKLLNCLVYHSKSPSIFRRSSSTASRNRACSGGTLSGGEVPILLRSGHLPVRDFSRENEHFLGQ